MVTSSILRLNTFTDTARGESHRCRSRQSSKGGPSSQASKGGPSSPSSKRGPPSPDGPAGERPDKKSRVNPRAVSRFFASGLWNVAKFARVPTEKEVQDKRDDPSFLKEVFPELFPNVPTGLLLKKTWSQKAELDRLRRAWYDEQSQKPPEERLPLFQVYHRKDGPQWGWFAVFVPNSRPDLKWPSVVEVETLVSLLQKALHNSENPDEEGE